MDAMESIIKNLDWSPHFYIIKNRNRGDFYIILFRNLCGEKSGKDNTGQEGGH